MKINKEKIRYILQYHYDKGKNAAQTCEKICAIYGEDILSKSAARKWFARFRAGNFDVKDEPRSGRPITGKFDEIIVKVERDKHVSTVEIARELGIEQNSFKSFTQSWIQKEAKGEKAQAIAKSGLTRKKVMLCVW